MSRLYTHRIARWDIGSLILTSGLEITLLVEQIYCKNIKKLRILKKSRASKEKTHAFKEKSHAFKEKSHASKEKSHAS